MKKVVFIICMQLFTFAALAQAPEDILAAKSIILPTIPASIGTYNSVVKSGNLLYLSGRGPLQANGKYITGKLGKELNTQQGYSAARLCAIAQIAVLKTELGNLSKIKRILKVTGFVNSTDEFTDQPQVINGFSDFMVELLGNKGIHSRSAVGVASLPQGWPVEVEMIVEIEN